MLKISEMTDRTVLAWFYRELVDLNWRIINGGPKVNAIFITNLRKKDRENFMGNWRSKKGFADGPIVYIHNVSGKIRAIDLEAEDLKREKRTEIIKMAKKYFIDATEQAQAEGVKVVLLAASTKKFFGEDGKELKDRFPNIVFTIGDNGTIYILRLEIFFAFKKAGLEAGRCRIGVLGANYTIGNSITGFLDQQGYNVVAVGPGTAHLKSRNIETCSDLENMGCVDAIIACTHNDKLCLKASHIIEPGLVRKKNKKVLVIDIAQPPNLSKREYKKCLDFVLRMDGGNAFSPDLYYVLGKISYKNLGFLRGGIFGCFGETLTLAQLISEGNEAIKNYAYNGFLVNNPNIEFMGGMMSKIGFTMPPSQCFSTYINSFDLSFKDASIVPVNEQLVAEAY